MPSDSDQPDSTPPPPAGEPERRPVIAVEDEALRAHLQKLLGSSAVVLETLDPDIDPLHASEDQVADFLILRRSSLGPGDLQKLDAHKSGPEVVVVTDGAEDIERTRLFSLGATGLLDAKGPAHELREAVEAIAASDGSSARNPHAGRDDSEPRLMDFQSRSPRMRDFLRVVERVVRTDSSLLVTGETGVGKERLAQAIHYEGRRGGAPFISVNCGAIPESLLESELFGHEAGAFTGAERRKKGRFELAEGGTIFLDEIGEMPLHLQVNLLTVLQRHRVQRVGGEVPIPIDVRVIAATNRDLEEEIAEGRFREDLFYRLNVVTLEVPPLRERADDIPDLVGAFIRHFRREVGHMDVDDITEEALDALMRYAWPGNVRQLINVVEHAMVMCTGTQITVADLPDAVLGHERGALAPATEAVTPTGVHSDLLDMPLREARTTVVAAFERAYLDAQLRRASGRIDRTAEAAGITARSLYDKLKQHGLRKEDYR